MKERVWRDALVMPSRIGAPWAARPPRLVRTDGRERAALEWARAIVWDADRADDDLWGRLHSFFSEEELVDLGCSIGFELGRTHFLRTLGVAP